ncbi:MAG TPA: response regulator, partial [Caulobacteraceae bacterium]
VFDPFFTTKPIGKGTGLGLSQVYGIAQQSGGTVRIDSLEGRGSTVEIWLPRAVADTVHELSPPPSRANAAGGRERVLIVEDDVAVRRFIAECLEGLGYAVTQASDGSEGLAAIQAETPDLLIVDYAMPGMNGVEVVTAVRTLAPSLPIILATGYADMEAVERVMTPDRVLRKPFPVEALESAVRSALATRANAAA